ncbi:Uncharacterised protein r2_g3426 [Pycnogonum litorale]
MARDSSCAKFVNLNVGQANLQRCGAANVNLTHLINNFQFDVAIQEPYTIDGDVPFDFRIVEPSGVLSKCGFIIGSSDLGYFHPSHLSTSNIAVLEILSFDFNLIMISAYFEPSVNIVQYLQYLEYVISLYPGYEVIVMVDVNSHSPSWGCDHLDARGPNSTVGWGNPGYMSSIRVVRPRFRPLRDRALLTLPSLHSGRPVLSKTGGSRPTPRCRIISCSPTQSLRVG